MSVGAGSLVAKMRSLPIIGSAASLMVGTIATSLLGLPFWILAARLYSGSSLGVASTGVNLTMILAEVSCLGLRSGLARYVPRAEGSAPKTILLGYLVGTTTAVVALGVFLLGFPLWGSNLSEMRSSAGVVVYVILAGACWAVFMLQDSVLVAIGKSAWVPIENTIFGLVKLALLFPFATWSPEFGIYWAWTLPVIPLVLVVNALIAREFLRSDSVPDKAVDSGSEPNRQVPTDLASKFGPAPGRQFFSEVMIFSLADWRSSLARLAGIIAISLLVIGQLGPVESGYFQIVWGMAFALFSLSATAAFALLTDRRGDRLTLGRNSLQVGALALGVTGLASVIGVLGAPLILRLFGSEFPDNASTLLRLLFLAAIPNVIYQMYLGYLRTQNRMRRLVVTETIVAVLAVSLTAVLLGRFGINGVGWAWLLSVGAISIYAVVTESVWWWASWVDTSWLRRAGRLLRKLRPGAARKHQAQLASALRSVEGVSSGQQARWERLMPGTSSAVLRISPTEPDAGPDPDWEVVFEFADQATNVHLLDAHERTIASLHDLALSADQTDPGGSSFERLLPTVIARSRVVGEEFTAWRRRAGTSALQMVNDGWSPAAVVGSVLPVLADVHSASSALVTVDRDGLDSWVASAMERLAAVEVVTEESLEGIRSALSEDLIGREILVGSLHGRLTLENIVLGPDPASVVGLRGWRAIEPKRPLFLDQAVLVVSELARQRNTEAGEVLGALLVEPSAFFEHPASPTGLCSDISIRSVLLLTWLYLLDFPHDERLALSTEFLWFARNARPVIEVVDDIRNTAKVAQDMQNNSQVSTGSAL